MNINLTAPINDLGYGVAGLNILKSLCASGNEVSLWPIGQPTVHNQDEARIVQSSMSNTNHFDFNAPSLRIWHQHDMAQHVGKGKRVGFPIFELNKFSKNEKHHLSSLDTIIVCSEWAKSIVKSEVNHPDIRVAPLGVDTSTFFHKISNIKKDTTVFLNVGKWEVRKGHDVLHKAFNRAFTKDDNVELWMMNHNPFLNNQQEKEWKETYLKSKLGRKIKMVDRVEQHSEVANIMSMADVGVFPSRAEGWNLEALEMMAMGKYVILTDYSAHTQFATQINSKLINIDNTESAHDGVWFNGQGEWASFGDSQMEQLISHMRTLHECKQNDIKSDRHNKNERGIITAKKFSWENSAKNIMETLE